MYAHSLSSLILARLQQLRLLDPTDIAERGVRVSNSSRSHSLHFISIGGARRFAVKSASRHPDVDPARLNREALIYRLATALPGQPPFLPRCHLAEGAKGLLVLKAIEGPTVHAYMQRRDAQPKTAMVCQALGQALGSAHQRFSPLSRSVPPGIPWTFHLFSPGPAEFVWGHPHMRWLLEHLENRWHWQNHLANIRHQWCTQTLMHGDLKWDNCVLFRSATGPMVCLIDWELAGWGDPAWDLACLVQELFAHHAHDDQELPATSIHLLWSSYCAATSLPWHSLEQLRRRIYAYVPVRMLQAALEEVRSFGPDEARVRRTLHLANTLLMVPATALPGLVALA